MLLAINANLPARNLHEFIALLKANPGMYHYGSSGLGAIMHLGGELFKLSAPSDDTGAGLERATTDGLLRAVMGKREKHNGLVCSCVRASRNLEFRLSRVAGCGHVDWDTRTAQHALNGICSFWPVASDKGGGSIDDELRRVRLDAKAGIVGLLPLRVRYRRERVRPV